MEIKTYFIMATVTLSLEFLASILKGNSSSEISCVLYPDYINVF